MKINYPITMTINYKFLLYIHWLSSINFVYSLNINNMNLLNTLNK